MKICFCKENPCKRQTEEMLSYLKSATKIHYAKKDIIIKLPKK